MKRLKFASTLACLVVALAACDNSKNKKTSGEQTQETIAKPVSAEDELELLALEVVAKESSFIERNDNDLVNEIKKSIKGVSVGIIRTSNAAGPFNSQVAVQHRLEVSVYDKNSNVSCEGKSVVSEIIKGEFDDSKRTVTQIADFGRFICINEDCANAVLFIEKFVHGDGALLTIGSVPVLLKRGEDNQFSPMSTKSDKFLQIEDAKEQLASCLFNAERAETTEKLALRRLIESRIQGLQTRKEQINSILESGRIFDKDEDVMQMRTISAQERTELRREFNNIRLEIENQERAISELF